MMTKIFDTNKEGLLFEVDRASIGGRYYRHVVIGIDILMTEDEMLARKTEEAQNIIDQADFRAKEEQKLAIKNNIRAKLGLTEEEMQILGL